MPPALDFSSGSELSSATASPPVSPGQPTTPNHPEASSSTNTTSQIPQLQEEQQPSPTRKSVRVKKPSARARSQKDSSEEANARTGPQLEPAPNAAKRTSRKNADSRKAAAPHSSDPATSSKSKAALQSQYAAVEAANPDASNNEFQEETSQAQLQKKKKLTLKLKPRTTSKADAGEAQPATQIPAEEVQPSTGSAPRARRVKKRKRRTDVDSRSDLQATGETEPEQNNVTASKRFNDSIKDLATEEGEEEGGGTIPAPGKRRARLNSPRESPSVSTTEGRAQAYFGMTSRAGRQVKPNRELLEMEEDDHPSSDDEFSPEKEKKGKRARAIASSDESEAEESMLAPKRATKRGAVAKISGSDGARQSAETRKAAAKSKPEAVAGSQPARKSMAPSEAARVGELKRPGVSGSSGATSETPPLRTRPKPANEYNMSTMDTWDRLFGGGRSSTPQNAKAVGKSVPASESKIQNGKQQPSADSPKGLARRKLAAQGDGARYGTPSRSGGATARPHTSIPAG